VQNGWRIDRFDWKPAWGCWGFGCRSGSSEPSAISNEIELSGNGQQQSKLRMYFGEDLMTILMTMTPPKKTQKARVIARIIIPISIIFFSPKLSDPKIALPALHASYLCFALVPTS
jgi:hypothetical protein